MVSVQQAIIRRVQLGFTSPGVQDPTQHCIVEAPACFCIRLAQQGGKHVLHPGGKHVLQQGGKYVLHQGGKYVLQQGGKNVLHQGGKHVLHQGSKHVMQQGGKHLLQQHCSSDQLGKACRSQLASC